MEYGDSDLTAIAFDKGVVDLKISTTFEFLGAKMCKIEYARGKSCKINDVVPAPALFSVSTKALASHDISMNDSFFSSNRRIL